MDLQEALRGLDRAAGETAGGAVPPPVGDLWDRGERWQRSRTRGSVAVAAFGVVVLALLSFVTAQRTQAPEPAVPPGSAPTLPDRVYDVSPWLSVGMPGEPVVAAQLTTRATWTGKAPAIAVLTGSGSYLYLDVPDVAEQSIGDVALAPDGRHLAYWATGTTSGSPQTAGGQHEPVTAVVVVDLVTGERRRHDFTTEHGLGPEALLWADDETLLGGQLRADVGDDGPSRRQGSFHTDPSWRWRAFSDSQPLDLPDDIQLDSFAEATTGQLLLGRRLIDLDSGTEIRIGLRHGTGSAGFHGSNAYLREDGILAELGGLGGDAVPNDVGIRDLRARRYGRSAVPDSDDTWQVLGWRDDHRLLVTRESTANGLYDPQTFDVFTLDVRTGTSESLIEGGDQLLGWSWATELLDAPVVGGVEPPRPPDPRLVSAAAIMVVLLTAFGIVAWRRRGRP